MAVKEVKDVHAQEIEDKVSMWEENTEAFRHQYLEVSNAWRMIPPGRKGSDTQLINTRVAEMLRATETLATLLFRMLTSADPNIEVVPMNDNISNDRALGIQTLLLWQQNRLGYKKKLMRSLRSLALFGTSVIEEPWTMWPNAEQPWVEGTDFIPKSLIQFAFNPFVADIEDSEWIAFIDFVTPQQLRRMAKMNPGDWNEKELEAAIEASRDEDNTPQSVKERRQAAGYVGFQGNMIQLVSYQGPLDGLDDSRDWWVGVINDKFVVKAHQNPFLHNMKNIRVAHYMPFELEPYGYGAGRVGMLNQRQLDGNRNLTMNLILMSMFNMWKVSPFSEFKASTLRIRPLGIIQADGLEPLKPDIAAANAGKKLDEILKEEFRSGVGATANLQAQSTDSTATEATIVQNEAIRRQSVYAEIIAEEFVRKHYAISHRNNVQFLDREFWISLSGEERPVFVNRNMIESEVDFNIRVVTDKDFRPNRNAQLLQFIQILTSVRQDLPRSEINVLPLIKEVARGFNIRPTDVIKEKTAVDKLLQQMQSTQAQQESGQPLPPIQPPNLPQATPGQFSDGGGL